MFAWSITFLKGLKIRKSIYYIYTDIFTISRTLHSCVKIQIYIWYPFFSCLINFNICYSGDLLVMNFPGFCLSLLEGIFVRYKIPNWQVYFSTHERCHCICSSLQSFWWEICNSCYCSSKHMCLFVSGCS